MQSHCPACGSTAKQTSAINHTVECQEFLFQCSNAKCGKEVLGVMRLRVATPDSANHFRQGIQSPAAAIKTDC